MPKLAPTALAVATPASTKEITCGFCATGTHASCPRAVANGDRPRKIWPCKCREPGCMGGGILRCLECKTEAAGEVNPTTWECLDIDACRVRQNKRLDANPAVQHMREYTTVPTIGETKPTKKTAKATRAPKAKPEPRDCACGCGGQTGGGIFRPGHDATLVRETVAQVAGANFTVKAKTLALKELKAAGASDKLVAKYEAQVAARQARGLAKTTPSGEIKPRRAAKKAASGKASAPAAAPADDEPEDDDGF